MSRTPVALVAGMALAAASCGSARMLAGDAAPPLPDEGWGNLSDAEPPTLDSLQGRVVVIFFSTRGYKPCHERGYPAHAKLEKRFAGDERVVFLYVRIWGSADEEGYRSGLADLRRHGIRGAYVYDARSGRDAMDRTFGVSSVPWSTILDPRGGMVFSAVTPKRPEGLEALVRVSLASLE
jgi:hypothetical protein